MTEQCATISGARIKLFNIKQSFITEQYTSILHSLFLSIIGHRKVMSWKFLQHRKPLYTFIEYKTLVYSILVTDFVFGKRTKRQMS